jgi:hypothetical protein
MSVSPERDMRIEFVAREQTELIMTFHYVFHFVSYRQCNVCSVYVLYIIIVAVVVVVTSLVYGWWWLISKKAAAATATAAALIH